jgi:hypothetical protein
VQRLEGLCARLTYLVLEGQLKGTRAWVTFLYLVHGKKRPVNERMINVVDIVLVLYTLRCFGNPDRYCLINLNVYKQTNIYSSLLIDCLYDAITLITTTTIAGPSDRAVYGVDLGPLAC